MSASIPKDPLFAKGGKVRRCRYCSSSRMAWAGGGRRIVVLVGSMCCVRYRDCLTLDVRNGRRRCSGPPKPSGGRIVIVTSLFAAENSRHHC